MQIPKEYSDFFKVFFKNFDNDLEKLKVLAYGVSITTLEDVFMKVGMLDDDELKAEEKPQAKVQESDKKITLNTTEASCTKNSGCDLITE